MMKVWINGAVVFDVTRTADFGSPLNFNPTIKLSAGEQISVTIHKNNVDMNPNDDGDNYQQVSFGP
ncbi:hypothetical protein [Blastomonas sp.]|uniref:hypothetical protein n=1 Tax=Blastomonas sp. TaxID=1909299 RepID=UPI003593077B